MEALLLSRWALTYFPDLPLFTMRTLLEAEDIGLDYERPNHSTSTSCYLAVILFYMLILMTIILSHGTIERAGKATS